MGAFPDGAELRQALEGVGPVGIWLQAQREDGLPSAEARRRKHDVSACPGACNLYIFHDETITPVGALELLCYRAP